VGQLPYGVGEIDACKIQLNDERNGWLVCVAPPSVHLTHDGGKTWHAISLPVAADGFSPIRSNFRSQRPWIAIESSVFALSPSGEGWENLFSLPIGARAQQIADLALSEDQRFVIAVVQDGTPKAAADIALVSVDSGKTWRSRQIQQGQYRKVAIGTGSFVYLIGLSKVLVSSDWGTSWRLARFAFSSGEREAKVFKEATSRPMRSFFFGSGGWLVYEQGYIFRTDDHGQSWYELARPTQVWPTNTSPASFTIWFLTTDHGYQVGGDGELRESYDGGFTWRPLSLGVEKISDISCVDITTCYAITRSGRLLRVESVAPGLR